MNNQEIAALKNLVRIGRVSSVDVEERVVRVEFADKQDDNGKPLISAPLKVLQNQPLIVVKRWIVDNSVPGEEPNTIKKIDITEENNPNYEGIYHSPNRHMGIAEKYAKGEFGVYEPDYIKDTDKTLIKIYPWLPYIGQIVVCLYIPNGGSDGFILGGI